MFKIRIIITTLLVFILISCTHHYLKNSETQSHFSLKEYSENRKLNKVAQLYKTKLDAETNKIIAISSDVLTKENDQSTLGNFVCDALKQCADSVFNNIKIDVVIVNRGGLRANLPKGSITVNNMFELMPFENEMVLLKIKGSKLNEGIITIIEKKHAYLGLEIELKNNSIESCLINNSKIDTAQFYTLITSDYLANGGDNFNFLKNPNTIQTSNLKIRDALIIYCNYLTKNNKQLIPYTDDRLQISK